MAASQLTLPFDERLATIYVLCDSRESDPIRRVRYVGRTVTTVAARLRRHKHDAFVGRIRDHRSTWWRSVVRGGGRVILEVIDRVPLCDMHTAEMDYIAKYRALGCDLTNTTDGGGGALGYRPSPETRERLRMSHLGNTSALGHGIMAKVTHALVAVIRARYAAGNVQQTQLALEYQLSKSAISRLVRLKTWRA